MSRLERERKTAEVMIGLYCRGQHGSREALCPACTELLAYALCRLERCPYGQAKPTCADCPIHCYSPAKRECIREAMRYAGPRLILHHPILALLHMLDGRRKAE